MAEEPEGTSEEPLDKAVLDKGRSDVKDVDDPLAGRAGSQGPEDSRLLFVQLVEERNLLKQQIALLEEKLAQQQETLKGVYRERDEMRERFRREQRQSNQLKRALESVVERASETRAVIPLDFPPKVELAVEPRTVAGMVEPTPYREGRVSPKLEDHSAAAKDNSTDSIDIDIGNYKENHGDRPMGVDSVKDTPTEERQETLDANGVLPSERQNATAGLGSVPNNVVLLRPLAEPLPLSPAASRLLQSQPAVELDNPLVPAEMPSPAAELAVEAETAAREVTSAPSPAPVEESISSQAPEPLPRPRPMLPAFASRSQPVGAKFLNETPPQDRETSRRWGDRPEVDCSERPERPVGGQVAPPPFWQDLQKNALPKGQPPAPRKRVTAFAAIQLPDFPPLR